MAHPPVLTLPSVQNSPAAQHQPGRRLLRPACPAEQFVRAASIGSGSALLVAARKDRRKAEEKVVAVSLEGSFFPHQKRLPLSW